MDAIIDYIFHGSIGSIYSRICLWRSDVAVDCQYRSEDDDIVFWTCNLERTVQHKLPCYDGRFFVGYDSYGGTVSVLPEAVY